MSGAVLRICFEWSCFEWNCFEWSCFEWSELSDGFYAGVFNYLILINGAEIMEEGKGRVIDKSFAFALSIIELYKNLTKESEFVISKQLLRSGTSIGANINEAQAASSKKDFLAKMSIAAKEARETDYWLKLLSQSQIVKNDYTNYLNSINEIIRMLTSIVKTTKNTL